MSSRKRSLSGDVNYETSCERKKQKKSERDASTVVDVSDDKSASIREKLRSKLLKKQQKSDEDNSNLEALEACRRKLLAAEFACEILLRNIPTKYATTTTHGHVGKSPHICRAS